VKVEVDINPEKLRPQGLYPRSHPLSHFPSSLPPSPPPSPPYYSPSSPSSLSLSSSPSLFFLPHVLFNNNNDYSKYGNNFAFAEELSIVMATTVLNPPTTTNIIAMEV
jgi:hypothetical protein